MLCVVLPSQANLFFSRLLGNVTLSQGGVLPNIHNALLPKKSKPQSRDENDGMPLSVSNVKLALI